MRKRRTRYQWLKVIGTVGPGADVEDDTGGIDFAVTPNTNGTSVVTIRSLLVDVPSDELVAQNLPMGTFSWNDYVIKRIVGKCFLGRIQAAVSTEANAYLVGAGLFVARQEDVDISATPTPIGSDTAARARDNYSPLRAENNHEPWIWRRTWLISNRLSTAADTQGARAYPATTADYGSIQDGPHIDAKTGRRVRDGERLWFAVAARQWPLNVTADTSSNIFGHLDLRVLGAPRKNRKRSTF